MKATIRSILLLALIGSLGLQPIQAAESEETAEGAEANGTPPPAPSEVDSAPPLPPRKPPLRLELQRAQQLAQQIAANANEKSQVHWFREGDQETYLGLFTQEYGETPQGYALILHDNQQHPNWPGLVKTLREQLPASGWSTLSISLPDRWNMPDIPPREPGETLIETAEDAAPETLEGTEQEQQETAPPEEAPAEEPPMNEMEMASSAMNPPPEEESSEPPTEQQGMSFTQLSVEYLIEDTPEIFRSRIEEALEYLKGMDPMPVIIVSIGTSATIVAKQVHDLRMRDIAGLVVIDPTPIPGDAFEVRADASGLRIPVLDVSPQFNFRSDPSLRKQNAKRQSRKTYEQHILNGANQRFEGFESQVTKKIRGWAKRVIINQSRFGYL